MKKNKIKIDKKELIITIVVLAASVIVGFIAGKTLYDIMY